MQKKPFDKIQHPFMIQTLQKMGIEGNLPQHSKGHIWESYSKHYSQWWKTESIPPKIKSKTQVSTFTTIIQYNFESPSYSNQRRKKIKEIQIKKEEAKLSLFADDMILYIENPKDTFSKLLELVSEFSKVAGYKINMQKSLAFLYNNNEKSEREIKESISFTLQQKELNI